MLHKKIILIGLIPFSLFCQDITKSEFNKLKNKSFFICEDFKNGRVNGVRDILKLLNDSLLVRIENTLVKYALALKDKRTFVVPYFI
jgi:hypothetical protein